MRENCAALISIAREYQTCALVLTGPSRIRGSGDQGGRLKRATGKSSGSRFNVAPVLWLLLLPASASLATEFAVPPEIRDWQSWVLDGHEQHQCPWLVPGSPNDSQRICAWPSPLTLQIDAHGGRFTQRWQAAAETWLLLPGNSDCWPESVTIDAAAAAVVSHAGVPAVRVASGSHLISGAFRWEHRPQALAV